MPSFTLTVLVLVFMVLAPFHCAVAEPVVSQHVTLELVSDREALGAAEDFRLALRIIPEEGWHIYWKNSGD